LAGVTVVLDASVLIAHFDPHDAHHDAATRLLIDMAGQALMAHPLTIAEVLVGPARVNRAVERRQSLREMRVDVIDIDDEAPIRLAILRAQTGLRMPDCCVLDAATSRHATLATFDDRLSLLSRARCVPVQPT
jgi:predicted nucleic acid-binding protein